MEAVTPGELVKVATGGPEIDGIVFDVPSKAKVVVAVVDKSRGPVLRTFASKALSERTEEGPDDRALHLLLRRTPPPAHDAARGGARSGGARPGHTRAAMHRTTGK
jgi:hypothetical protein